MKKAICIVMMLLLLIPNVLVSQSQTNEERKIIPLNDQLDQYQTHWDKWWRVLIVFPNAQSFIPTLDTLTRVELILGREGTPTDELKVSIREKIDGDDLTSIYIPMEDIPKGKQNMTWIVCDFPDIYVQPGKTYYIVCESKEKDENEAYAWAFSREDRYPYGCRWYLHPLFNKWVKEEEIDFCFKTYGINSLHPFKPERPSGPSHGRIGKSYTYSTYTTDPKNSKLKYCFDWGDGNLTWTDFFNSGERVECSHTWKSEGNFTIRVKAKNEEGYESAWSDPLVVSMPYSPWTLFNKINEWLMQLFGRELLPKFL